MSNASSQSEGSYGTDLRSVCVPVRTITDYEIPGLGLVRCQTLLQGELGAIRKYPPESQYAAAIASIIVDTNGDTTHILDDETVDMISQMNSKVFDCFVDIINSTVLNQVSVDDMIKN